MGSLAGAFDTSKCVERNEDKLGWGLVWRVDDIDDDTHDDDDHDDGDDGDDDDE